MLFWASISQADDQSREEDLFGSSESNDFQNPNEPIETNQSSRFEDSLDFGLFDDQDATPPKSSLLESLSNTLAEQDNRLDIGGKLFFSTLLLSGNEADIGESSFNNNATIDLYFDAALADDVRFFYQQKITHSIEGDDSLITLFLSQLNERSDIDQLWLKFPIRDKYFFTLGRQPTKLGSGFIWQPTDFLNIDQFNPLDIFDQRLGVNLIKLQIPLTEIGVNLYAIAQLNDVEALEDIGALFRAEYLTKSGEYAITLNTQQKKSTRIGFDLSKGINILDFTFSVAFIHNDPTPFFDIDFSLQDNIAQQILNAPETLDRSDQWLHQVSSGFLYSKTIFGNKTLIMNGEVFYNQAGYDSSNPLTFIIVNSLIPIANIQNTLLDPSIDQSTGEFSFNPLYFSKKYAALGLILMGLGKDKDQTATVLTINNLDDQTGVLQMIYSAQPFRDLHMTTSVGWFYGGEGTFRPNIDFSEIPFLSDLSINPPRFSAEVQFSIVF